MTVIVCIPGYDCFEYLTKCLATVKAQDYADMRVVVIDDDSPDERQRKMVESVNRLPGWTGRVNTARQFCPRNIWDAVQLADAEPDDVFFLLDADDWLPDANVISRVAAFYEDSEVWFSYGGYKPDPPDPGCHVPQPYPPEVIRRGSYRTHHLQEFNHAVVFRKFLWEASITEADLKLDDGITWMTGGYDQAICIDMLCRAGHHQRCISGDVWYSYRSNSPVADAIVHRAEVMEASRVVLSRPTKPPIEPVLVRDLGLRKSRTPGSTRPVKVRRA